MALKSQVNNLSRRLIETNYESEDLGGSSGDFEAHFKQLVKSSEISYPPGNDRISHLQSAGW